MVRGEASVRTGPYQCPSLNDHAPNLCLDIDSRLRRSIDRERFIYIVVSIALSCLYRYGWLMITRYCLKRGPGLV